MLASSSTTRVRSSIFMSDFSRSENLAAVGASNPWPCKAPSILSRSASCPLILASVKACRPVDRARRSAALPASAPKQNPAADVFVEVTHDPQRVRLAHAGASLQACDRVLHHLERRRFLFFMQRVRGIRHPVQKPWQLIRRRNSQGAGIIWPEHPAQLRRHVIFE
jgi:hypothetical protein